MNLGVKWIRNFINRVYVEGGRPSLIRVKLSTF